jgi:hypothetical protein
MRKWLAIAVVLIAIAPDCAIGQGNTQQPPPCPAPHSATARKPKPVCECCQNQSDAEQRGTETAPFVIKVVEADQAQKEAGTSHTAAPKKPNQSWSLSDKIALIASSFAFLQFLTLVATIWIMMQNGQRQLRAYVVVERGIIGNVANPIHNRVDKVETVARIIDPQAGPTVQITIKNTGQTPAYKVVHWGRICVENFPLTAVLPPMPEPDSKFWSVMGPGIAETKTLRLPYPLSEEDIEGLRNGTRAIYCHGEIDYFDAFKKKHWTKYRCMYGTVCGVIGISTDMTYCEDGNDAD